VTQDGAEEFGRRRRVAAFWAERRSRWTLPLVIIVVIIIVAVIDHVGAHQISQVDQPVASDLVATKGGSVTVDIGRPWDGLNPNTPAGADSSTPTLLASVLPSAYTMTPKLDEALNGDLLNSVEVTSTDPLTIQYQLNPAAVWSDGVPVSADDFIYAWQSQRGDGVDIDKSPTMVASTLGYRDVASVTGSNGGKTVTVLFTRPFTDWRLLFDGMVPAHIARKVGWNHGFDVFNPEVDLSAGPFVVQAETPFGNAVLVRNPKWWGATSGLAKVDVSVAFDPAVWTNVLAGSDQSVVETQQFGLASLNSVTSLPNSHSTVKPSLAFAQLEFNVTSPTMSWVAVREAVAHTVNRKVLLSRTFGAIDPGLVLNQDHLAVASQASYVASSAASAYDTPDPGASDRLLASVGFHRAPNGHYEDVLGRPITIRLVVESGDPWIDKLGQAIVVQLQSAGITVVASEVNGVAGLAAASASGGYDVALVTRTASSFPTATERWYSDGFGPTDTKGSHNWSHFDDPAVDQQFSEASQMLLPEAGAAVDAQIDDQLWDQMVALPLFGEPALVAQGVQVSSVQYNASEDGLFWNLPAWAVLRPKPAKRG
jgi:peptide/nickel transport system substrate-binding protein